MSEAVVDDIVAVLPPLLQSLEALGFVARYLNPPDFDRVMEAVGQPDEALRAVRPRLAEWPEEFAAIRDARWRPRATRRLRHSKACASCKAAMATSSPCFARLRHAPRAQEALYPLTARLPPVSRVLRRSRVARGRRSRGAAGGAGQRQHRHLSRPQRARQPRRLLALRAGILHARPRLAAGDGAAWRQRQRPRLPVELAARCPQPRRDPGRADRDRHHLGADGRGHRHAEPRRAFSMRCGRAGTSIRRGCC